MLLIATAIKIISPGTVFFVQKRVGFHGKTIELIKFRTMYFDAEKRLQKYLYNNPKRQKEWEQYYTLKNDPRVIPYIGNFLRKTSLDELPNLINVLAGDISLIGPRPLPIYEFRQFNPDFQKIRQSVLPGVTGLWQIKRGDNQQLIILDTYYINNWSLKLDFKIFFQTILLVLFANKPHY